MIRKRYRFDTHFLTLAFFVIMPLVTFGAFFVISIAKDKLQTTVGRSLEQQALETKIVLERYIGDRIVHLRLLSQNPMVMNAVLDRSHLSPNQMSRLESAWQNGRPLELTAPFLATPLAARLRETTSLLPAIRLLQVVNADGLLVSSSARSGRLDLRDRTWFAAMAREEFNGAYVGEIQRTTTRAPGYLEIAYPVFHPQAGYWIGAVCGVISAGDLYAVLAPVRIGYTGRALLLRASDGMILASDETERVLRDTFSGFSSIRTSMQARQGYWIVPRQSEWSRSSGVSYTEPARLIGFTLVDQLPGVRWIVVVEQSLDEATAPVRDVTRYLWIHFLGALAAVALLSTFLSLRQERPIIEEALHIHEDHVPPSMQAGPSQNKRDKNPAPKR
ncbi:MAG: cache domain-containing protein [Vicinamibacteria bacterium]|nr:cache domain-containing protein [Vicinamibacteria bacterium]